MPINPHFITKRESWTTFYNDLSFDIFTTDRTMETLKSHPKDRRSGTEGGWGGGGGGGRERGQFYDPLIGSRARYPLHYHRSLSFLYRYAWVL